MKKFITGDDISIIQIVYRTNHKMNGPNCPDDPRFLSNYLRSAHREGRKTGNWKGIEKLQFVDVENYYFSILSSSLLQVGKNKYIMAYAIEDKYIWTYQEFIDRKFSGYFGEKI